MSYGFCFCFLSGVSINISNFAVGLKISATTAEIKHCKSIIKKKGSIIR